MLAVGIRRCHRRAARSRLGAPEYLVPRSPGRRAPASRLDAGEHRQMRRLGIAATHHPVDEIIAHLSEPLAKLVRRPVERDRGSGSHQCRPHSRPGRAAPPSNADP
jgi:hypothetical protein